MKKTLLLAICIAAFTVQGIGQVSIIDADIASIGASFSQRSDTLPSVVPGTTGTAQTWNFSALASHETLVITAVDPLTLPLGSRFTGANIALHEDASINNYFFNKTAAAVTTIGLTRDILGNGDTICLIFNTPDTMISFPSEFGTSFTAYVNGDTKTRVHMLIDTVVMGNPVQVPVDSVRIIHHAVKTSEMDAEGNLTMATGTVAALRQQTYETSIDSAYGYVNYPPFIQGWYFFQSYTDTTTQFIWWTKYAGNAIVKMDYDANSATVTRVDWLNITNIGLSTESALTEALVYPNPAQDYVTVNAPAGSEICIFNNVGAKVMSDLGTGQLQNLNVSELPRGLYFVRHMGNSGYTTTKVVLQ